MAKLSKERKQVIDKVVKSFSLLSTSDKTTIITRDNARVAIPVLQALADEIIRLVPKYNSKRVREGIHKPTHAITVLRQIIRLKNRKLLSIKRYKWDKQLKKKYSVISYKLL